MATVAAEPGILRPVDLSHPARAEGRQDFVGAETSAGMEGHRDVADNCIAERCAVADAGISGG